MIRMAESAEALCALCVGSPFGCQILSAAEAYGLDRPFAQFWMDATAAYGKMDGVMRIAGTAEDGEEARAFLSAIGAEEVLCSAENAEKLGLTVTQRGAVLVKERAESSPRPSEAVSLREMYTVLHACKMVDEFEPFYLDLSHRVRHGTARCTALYDGETMAATAAAVLGKGEDLITAVAVLPQYRGQGLGRAVVGQMERQLSGRLWVLRAENENERFYASLGYTPCGVWCAGKL